MDQDNKPKTKRSDKPKKPKRSYSRERTKKQFTVRIDEELSRAVIARAEGEGLRLTDAMEAGLWLWLQRKHEPETIMRGRFLWNVIPMRLQRLTLRFWAFVFDEQTNQVEEAMRQFIDHAIWVYGEDPHYAERLKILAEAREPERGEEANAS